MGREPRDCPAPDTASVTRLCPCNVGGGHIRRLCNVGSRRAPCVHRVIRNSRLGRLALGSRRRRNTCVASATEIVVLPSSARKCLTAEFAKCRPARCSCFTYSDDCCVRICDHERRRMVRQSCRQTARSSAQTSGVRVGRPPEGRSNRNTGAASAVSGWPLEGRLDTLRWRG